MIFGSVCSGIEAASTAWKPLGWKAAFFSEIEPFPSAVLAHHYPETPNLGDMLKFKDWNDHAIDILVGGTPCQSFSVAGLREGLADPRGNLMLTYLAIAARFRPRWLVWENVPGVLSIDQGRTFGTLLRGMAELGYGFAYRILDAQYVRTKSHPFAVPQRRRRVFVVGHLGDWRRAAAVLFERESLRGDPTPRRHQGKRVAPTLEARASAGGAGWGTDFMTGGGLTTADCLRTRRPGEGGISGDDTHLIPSVSPALNSQSGQHHAPDTKAYIPEVVGTISDGAHNGGGLNGQDAYTGRIFPVESAHSAAPPITSNPYGDHESRDGLLVAHALTGEGFDASEGGSGRATPVVPVAFNYKASASQSMNPSDVAPACDVGKADGLCVAFQTRGSNLDVGAIAGTIGTNSDRASGGAPMVAFSCKDNGRDATADGATPTLRGMGHDKSHANGGGQIAIAMQAGVTRENPASGPDGIGIREDGAAFTLEARAEVQAVAFSGRDRGAEPAVGREERVRRLTPRECEKLQGFTTVTNRVTITACCDPAKNSVRVEIKCHRLLNSASPADENGSIEFVQCADVVLRNDQASLGAVAAVHVRMSYAPKVVGIRSQGRWLWCANGAGNRETCPRHTLEGNFALALVAVQQEAEVLARNGKAESPASTMCFTLPKSGSWPAGIFGQESAENANDAAPKLNEDITFITSNRGLNILASDSHAPIWLFSAIRVIASFIPRGTRIGNFAEFVIDVESDYTAITIRGKPAADGPRYRALGNSMACNVMAWIGERIAQVETL